MWSCSDNQEVGLEAAILERVRNSSLVKWFRADNVAGLKHTAEVADPQRLFPSSSHVAGVVAGVVGGRGASCTGGSLWVTAGGRCGSENAGMSSDTRVRSPSAE